MSLQGLLEPVARKRARPVLRGPRRSNAPGLPDDIEDGERPGSTVVQSAELREAKRRIRTLEQEVEVLRRAAAYFSQAHLPGK